MKALKNFDQIDKFMCDKHEIAMPFVRGWSNSSYQPSAVQDSAATCQGHLTAQEQETEGPTETLPEKGKSKQVERARNIISDFWKSQRTGKEISWFLQLESLVPLVPF